MLNAIALHPKLMIFGIGLIITVVIGSTIGTPDHSQQVLSYMRRCPLC